MVTKEDLDRKVKDQTICSRFLETVAAHGDRVALRAKHPTDPDGWETWTYREYADRVARAAAGLQSLGVEPGDRVVLMMRNIPAFHVVDLAVAFCGATSVSIYNSSPPDQVHYLTEHCKAKVAVVEDEGFLQRFLAVRDQLPNLKHLMALDPGGLDDSEVLAGDLLLDASPLDLPAALDNLGPETLATVIYTSGTTGPPKGVMLNHYNVVWTAQGYLDLLDIDPAGFRVISYLPMAHIAERMSGHYLAALSGFDVATCPDPSQIGTYAREVHPESMFGVPRVWEKIHAGVQAALSADPEQKARFDDAVETAIPIAERRTMGEATPEDEETWAFLDEVAFSKIRQLVGLDALNFAITGAAPIPAELIRWYRAIGVPLSEIYGLSESTGPLTWEPYRVKPGTVGVAFPGCEVFLGDDGEVCLRGGNVFKGYLDDPERTAGTLDDDGTLYTGDIGEIDDEGYLRIIDRKKELIITAGGKNVSPANLEAAIKTSPLVGQACAVGDGRPYVAALVVLDPEVAPAWATERGIDFDGLADLAKHPKVRETVEADVERVMVRFAQAERVKRIAILDDEWLPDSDELTPTSKLKRRGILSKYAGEIAALYQ